MNQQMVAIIMDEVDGMSSGDRGGLAELTSVIKQFHKIIEEWITNKNRQIKDTFTTKELERCCVNRNESSGTMEISCMTTPTPSKTKKGKKPKTGDSSVKQDDEPAKKIRRKRKKIKIPALRISPIINICNTSVDKKLSDLKKLSVEFIFDKPKTASLEKTCLEIIDREKMNVTSDALKLILQYGQSDFRKLLMLLEEIYRNFRTREITVDMLRVFLDTNIRKQIDLTIFEATRLLYKTYPSDSDMIYYYETDRSLIAMMVHENIYSQINSRRANQYDKMDQLLKIVHHFSLGDIIDKYIYNFQCWNLQDINGYIKCSIPSFYLNQYPVKKKNEDSQINFTSVLSRQAVQLNNMKVAVQIKRKCRVSRRYMSQVGAIMVQRLRFPEIVEPEDRDEPGPVFYQLANRYNIELSNIEKIIKMQTWDLTPIHLTKKNRNHLKQYLSNE